MPKRTLIIRWGALAVACVLCRAAPGSTQAEGEPRIERIVSSADGSEQPILMLPPPEAGAQDADSRDPGVPLLVHLHTWSGDVHQASPRDAFLAEARRRGWAFVHPHFRGPNRTPEACGSDLARQDVLDAIDFMRGRYAIDPDRIYLAGTSGGGHMALLLASTAGERFGGVAAAVPPTDLAAWHAFQAPEGRYAADLEAVCHEPPSAGSLERLGWTERDECYRSRSPLTLIHHARGVPLHLSVGVRDGHGGDSVPVSHTLRVFDAIAIASGEPGQRIGRPMIAAIDRDARVPAGMRSPTSPDSRLYDVLFSREIGTTRLEITDAGHNADIPAMVAWLEQQRRPPKAKADRPRRVLVLGDSNAAGDHAWPRVLAALRPSWQITNRSIAGATFGFDNNGRRDLNTLAGLEERIEASGDRAFDAIVVALGTNDAKADFADRQPEAVANAAEFLRRLRRFAARDAENVALIVLLPPPVWPDDRAAPKYRGAEARLASLRDALRSLAVDGERVLDLHRLLADDPATLTDGVHLSHEAQWDVARLVEAALDEPRRAAR